MNPLNHIWLLPSSISYDTLWIIKSVISGFCGFVSDFGLSNIYREDDPLKTHCGSPEYAAPELFVVGKHYGPEIDIWSL